MPNRISIFFFNFMKNSRKIELWFLSRNGAVHSTKLKKLKKHKRVNEHPWATTEASDGSRPPRSAAASDRLFRRQRLGGYGSRRLLDGLAPPRRPTRAAATGI